MGCKLMAISTAVFAVSALGGPASSQNVNFAAIDQCYLKQAVVLDDHASDPFAIARVVRFTCRGDEEGAGLQAQQMITLSEPLSLRAAALILRLRVAERGKKP